jgi:hypothetical protein
MFKRALPCLLLVGSLVRAERVADLLDFADQHLLKKPGTRRFDVLPPREDTP